MAELQTQKTSEDPKNFLSGVENERRRKDAFVLLEMMEDITGAEAVMWGPAIIGFGSYRYQYKSGREMDWFEVGFSPRKANLSLYVVRNTDKFRKLLSQLGKHKTSKACLYINKLADVNEDVLRELISESVRHLRKKAQKNSR